MAAFNLGTLFGAAKDRRPDVMARIATVPIQDRTTATVFRIMSEVGVENQGAMYDYLVKSGVVPKELDLYKEQQKSDKGSANQLPLTPELLDLVQSQVPSYRPQTQPQAPLGKVTVGASSLPLTPELLQGLVPELKAAPVPGQPSRSLPGLPPEALFGPDAAEAVATLPRVPVPGQTIPTTLVTQAAEAATRVPKTKVPGLSESRAFIAGFLFPDTPADQLSAAEKKTIFQFEEQSKQEIARLQGTGRIQAEQAAPLDEDATKWIDPETGKNPPPSLSRDQAKAAGYRPFDDKNLSTAKNAKAALRQMIEYIDLARDLNFPRSTGSTAQDLINVQSYRAQLAIRAAAGDPDAKRLRGLFGSITAIARATGDAANIAVAERNQLREFVLTETETYESAIAKLAQAMRIMISILEAGGERVPDDLRRKSEELEFLDLQRKRGR